MEFIDKCYEFYVNNLEMFDQHGKGVSSILDEAVGDHVPRNVFMALEDDLSSYACDAERHGFEAGFRFALASQILLGDMGQMKKNQNILMNQEGGKA